ncbi:ABC transporter ATP-binding protein [Paenibacillus sp. EPM92]|uniref:ABC transporter ATP-binding protein n=1 Tax=Paenibacillus sp. EPM92 TaxID=1561195 RepID=UPI001F34DADB|nr:ABC transporter ATP-binding protein [Paenibacillus sp. EPM92]
MFGQHNAAAERDVLLHELQGISLQDISLEFHHTTTPVRALDGIQLRMKKNEFVCVLGPSGCGKSSLLHIIAGYVKPTTGTVHIDGTEHNKPDSKVGVVFQHANLFPWLSISGNIEFGLKMGKVRKAERKLRVKQYLQLVGLDHYASLLPHQLSGGMKQRAAIARTLATEPDIILLDEPFSALDALTRESMQQHMREIWRQTQKCLFFITHDVDEALLLASRIIIMHPSPGRIVQDFDNPLHLKFADESFEHIRSTREFAELRTFLFTQIASHIKK